MNMARENIELSERNEMLNVTCVHHTEMRMEEEFFTFAQAAVYK
jgi:hypothetical protein